MNSKVIGIVLIIAGVALTLWGYNSYDSASSQIMSAVSGDAPMEAWAAMIGGVACMIVGIGRVK